jgi:hypothetical protein
MSSFDMFSTEFNLQCIFNRACACVYVGISKVRFYVHPSVQRKDSQMTSSRNCRIEETR